MEKVLSEEEYQKLIDDLQSQADLIKDQQTNIDKLTNELDSVKKENQTLQTLTDGESATVAQLKEMQQIDVWIVALIAVMVGILTVKTFFTGLGGRT